MSEIHVKQPDGSWIVRRATKADDDRFYKGMSMGIDKGGLTVYRQGLPPSQPRPAKPPRDPAE